MIFSLDKTEFNNGYNWNMIDRHIAKMMNPFKRITDSFSTTGVLTLQQIIYIKLFKEFTYHDKIPIYLQDDFMKFIIKNVKNYMFNDILPHQNFNFTKYLFRRYGSKHHFVELFAYGFTFWTYKYLDINHFISWISWILYKYEYEYKLFRKFGVFYT